MKTHLHWKNWFVVLLCALALASSVFAGSSANSKEASAGVPVVHVTDADGMRVAGEKRFRANCGRCHAAPLKFPPRMMGTILRHMRVRATITDEYRRLIQFYMTQ
jgi:cytochrome c5